MFNIKGKIYRLVSRILHKFDLHYMPKGFRCEDYYCKLTKKNYPVYQHWCRWCGLRCNQTDFNIIEELEKK